MFSGAITELKPWTDQGMFENVSGTGFRDRYSDQDVSLTAVAKALFSRRLPDGESIKIKIYNLGDGDNIITQTMNAIRGLVDLATDGVMSIADLQNTIIISQYTGSTDFEKLREVINNDFVAESEGKWKVHNKAEVFLNKEMKACVLINEDSKAAIVITDKLTMSHWHLLGSMLPTYVPALFTDEDLDTEEKAVLRAMTMRSKDSFIGAMAALEDKYDIRGQKIHTLIAGFEVKAREQQVAAVENELEQLFNEAESLMSRYRDLMERRDDLNIRRNGLKYSLNDTASDDSLVEFFQANKSLDVVDVYGSQITFIVRTYFENFDVDMYERCRENSGFLEESAGRGVFANANNRRKIMDAMFLTGKLRLRMCALYKLDIRGTVNTIENYDFPANCTDYIPNYHLDHHGCFGDYRRVITGYLDKGDTIGAINACIASAKSVNIGETGATFNPMMTKVFNSTRNIFDLPDGRHVTPAKALEWLNEQEGEASV